MQKQFVFWTGILGVLLFVFTFTFFIVLNFNLDSPYKGLIQRIIEVSILFWIVYGSFYFSNKSYQQIVIRNLYFTFDFSIKYKLWFINLE
jgi:hypothetical protein